MRAFVAVRIPPDVQDALAQLPRQLDAARPDVKWVGAGQFHVTLKFLDDITPPQQLAVEASLRRLAASEPPFSIRLEGVGAFPSLASPRVLWVGIAEGQEPLRRLAAALEQTSLALQLRQDARPFSAHVTIGRVRSARRLRELADGLRACAWPPPPPWQARSVTLFRSELSTDGSRYTVLAEVPLAGPPAA